MKGGIIRGRGNTSDKLNKNYILENTAEGGDEDQKNDSGEKSRNGVRGVGEKMLPHRGNTAEMARSFPS